MVIDKNTRDNPVGDGHVREIITTAAQSTARQTPINLGLGSQGIVRKPLANIKVPVQEVKHLPLPIDDGVASRAIFT